jgi:hypothetical protein
MYNAQGVSSQRITLIDPNRASDRGCIGVFYAIKNFVCENDQPDMFYPTYYAIKICL